MPQFGITPAEHLVEVGMVILGPILAASLNMPLESYMDDRKPY